MEFDPITGRCVVRFGEPATTAKPTADDADLDQELIDWEEHHG
jgi:hypothetical protein